MLNILAGCIHCLLDERAMKFDWDLSPQIPAAQDKIQASEIAMRPAR